MKKLIFILAAFFLMSPIWSHVSAESDDVSFIMQKARASVEKIASLSHETKPFTADVQSAQDYLKKAEAALEANTSWRGKINQAAVPTIKHYANLSEIMCQIVLSRLEKVKQEQENARLEKLIPETESKIKVFDEKNKEIKLLREEIAKPKGDMKNISRELQALKLEKIDMTKEVTLLKNEKTHLAGQVTALNGVVLSLKNDVVDKTKKIDELTKALESQKGQDAVKAQNKMSELNRINSFWQDANQMNVLSKLTPTGITLIIPRRNLIKTPAMNLAPSAGKIIEDIAGLMKKYPETRAQMKVYGFGKPDKTENAAATAKMAAVIKEALVKAGVEETNINISGVGTASPLYSKNAVEDNRRVEVTFSGMISKE